VKDVLSSNDLIQGNENKRSKKKLAKIQLTYIATSSTKGSSLRA